MNDPHVCLWFLKDFWDSSSISGNDKRRLSWTEEAGYSHQVRNRSALLAAPSVLGLIGAGDSWFKILFHYSNLIWPGWGPVFGFFQILPFHFSRNTRHSSAGRKEKSLQPFPCKAICLGSVQEALQTLPCRRTGTLLKNRATLACTPLQVHDQLASPPSRFPLHVFLSVLCC